MTLKIIIYHSSFLVFFLSFFFFVFFSFLDSIRRITCFLSSSGVFRGDVTYDIQNSDVTVNIACELCATSISVTLVKRVKLVNQTLLEEFIIQTSLLYFRSCSIFKCFKRFSVHTSVYPIYLI